MTDTYGSVAGITGSAQLTAAYNALGTTSATVIATNGDQNLSVGATTAVFVNESISNVAALNQAPLDGNGGFVIGGQYATFINNTSGSPTYLEATGSAAWIKYEGGGQATIDGGSTDRFIGDASGITNPVTMYASNGEDAQSWLMGGDGLTTMYGPTSNTSATATLTAGGGSTTMYGGVGSDTMYGGGATTVFGGTGSETFSDGNISSDSIVAGSHGGNTYSVFDGGNTVDDGAGSGDFVNVGADGYVGTGTTTIDGSTGGTSIGLFGSANVVIGDTTGAEAIFASSSGTSTVSFAGASASDLATIQANQATAEANGLDSITVSFTSASGATQIATVNNITHITFK